MRVQQRTLHIRPVRQLQGAEAAAPDLRGGAALVIAALAARGRSRIAYKINHHKSKQCHH